jgi:four helix bundle protein
LLIVIGYWLLVKAPGGKGLRLLVISYLLIVEKNNKKSFKSFEDLKCWRACTEVRRYITKLVKKYPKEEKYALVDVMKKAARSTTHNLAEGFGRFHFQKNVQFCRISRGSLYELIDQLITSKDDGYITTEEYETGRDLINKALPLVNGYIKYLSHQKDQTTNKSSPILKRITNN